MGGHPPNADIFPTTVQVVYVGLEVVSNVYRRQFLQTGAIGFVTGAALPGRASALSHGEFADVFGSTIIQFFDDDWDDADLGHALGETVDHTCYAYGAIAEDEGFERDSGYLSRLKELGQNSEVYGWALRNLEYFVDFLERLDVFSDDLGERLSSVSDSIRKGTKLVPLVWSVKGVLDSGCSINNQLETGEGVAAETYLDFFKRVALVAVEIVLLALGASVAYKGAFRATGWVNQRLINTVGREMGWQAYSWVLSQIHWGVRVVFAEGMGQAIDETVETVTEEVVDVARESDGSSEKEVRSVVRENTERWAEATDGWDTDYEEWKIKREIAESEARVEQRTEGLWKGIHDYLERIPF